MASKANSIVSLKRPAGEHMAEEYWTEERRRSVAPIQLPVARAKLRGAAKAPAPKRRPAPSAGGQRRGPPRGPRAGPRSLRPGEIVVEVI